MSSIVNCAIVRCTADQRLQCASSYDAAGNLVTVKDARGFVTTQIYETTSNRLHAVQDATGARTSYSYDVAGQTLSVQNARGYRTTYSYDLAGRTRAIQDALGYRTTTSYDRASQQVAVMNARNNTFTTIYDALGRVEATQTPLNIRTTQVYDAAGQTIASVDGDGYRWSTIYDPGGRVIASQTPLNHRTTTTYDKANRPVEVQNPRGYVSTTTYDLASQVTAQTNPLGHQRQYGYDADGRNVTIANAIGGVITMAYDASGQMLAIANELNQRTSYTYDPVGNVATRRFANGDETLYGYDPVGREETRLYADGSMVTFMYDAIANLTTMMDALGVATYTYDALSQRLLEVDEGGRQLLSSYNGVGQRTGLSMGDIGITPAYQWQYDEDGRMIQVTDSLSKTVVTSYNQRGMTTTLIYSGGRNQVFAYDEDGRNISIDDQHAIKVQGFDYQFDANGNRIETKEGSVVSTYVYDAVDRLIADNTSGTGAHTFAYSYDSRGNILTNNETGTTITHTYDAASRLTTSIEGSVITTYTFDLNGNMTVAEKGANAAYMTYDPENQMGSHEDENGDATYYSYDPHARLKQDVHLVGTTRWYVWMDDLIVRQDDTSGLKRIFTVNDGVIVGEVYSVTSHAQTRSYLEDFLGSVTGEMSTSNVVSNARRFTPYGRDWLGAATVAHSPSWIGGHGYHPTGLKWAGYSVFHRVVAPETGQWTTRDPLWPEEWAYAYVDGNPTTLIDPMGLWPLTPKLPCHQRPPFIPPNIWERICPRSRGRYGFTEDLGFTYGNYCGKDTVWQTSPSREPIDCLDECCRVHDGECEKWNYFGPRGRDAHCVLALCAAKCLAGGCLKNHGKQWWNVDRYFDCVDASISVLVFFSTVCNIAVVVSPFVPAGGRRID